MSSLTARRSDPSIVTALDVKHGSREQPLLNIKSASKTISSIDQTIHLTTECIKYASLAAPPTSTDDHQFKRCKRFRCSHLAHAISDIWKQLAEIFYDCTGLVQHWQRLTNPRDGSAYQRLDSYREEAVIVGAVSCNQAIDKIIELSQASDVIVLGDLWGEKVEALNQTIDDLSSMTRTRSSGPNSRLYHALFSSPTDLMKHVVELLKWTTLLTKLARIHLHSISKTKTRKLTFTLETTINSHTLSQLNKLPAPICDGLRALLDSLTDIYMDTGLLTGRKHQIRNQIKDISKYFNHLSITLVQRVVPLPPGDDGTALESDYNAWISTWQDAWRIATDHFLNALDNGPDEHQDMVVDEE
ncbi:hypothetical protein MJO28_001291 [Puccinia striiformis f. sp. tritici]|uniref:Uncharacterized protein n=1 Tax=Puccinia striiformis f. sp. tritici TaxID=168172 RepID=A0ACC0ETJ4_9BASI|nr:hypothetical protein MJO28_001291 [Puccinia striiformis f. sp. tritici]